MTMITAASPGPADMHLRRGSEITKSTPTRDPRKAPRMVRLTVNLPSDLVERMRDAVYWTPGLTLAWLIARAVQASLADLETIHQGPFPRRLKPLRAGRPRLLGQAMHLARPLLASEGATGTGKNGTEAAVPLLTQSRPQRIFEGEEKALLNTPRMPK
jgi:hypothetical protein